MREIAAAIAVGVTVVAGAHAAAGQFVVALPPGGSQATTPLISPIDGPKPEFEVASVRPNSGNADRLSINSPPGRFMTTGLPLQSLLTLAFRVRAEQVEGVPDWARSARFDINAKAPDGASQDEIPLMLQSLLEDRFALEWHAETREIDIYELVLAREDGRLGPKLARSNVDCRPILEARQRTITEARDRGESPEAIAALLRSAPGEGPRCTTNMSMRAPQGGGLPVMTMATQGMEMGTLVSLLTSLSGRPVVDRTGLTGTFDYEFTFSPSGAPALTAGLAAGLEAARGGAAVVGPGAPTAAGVPGGLGAVPTAADVGPSVFEAVEEQFGLKLQPARGPGEFLVIDGLERPEPD